MRAMTAGPANATTAKGISVAMIMNMFCDNILQIKDRTVLIRYKIELKL